MIVGIFYELEFELLSYSYHFQDMYRNDFQYLPDMKRIAVIRKFTDNKEIITDNFLHFLIAQQDLKL